MTEGRADQAKTIKPELSSESVHTLINGTRSKAH
jgi:hypothetical protein